LNIIVEQSHRNVKRRIWLAKGYGSLPTACRTLRGIEAMEMVKSRARWVSKGDVVRQAKFINKLSVVTA
jgi:transposase-like protein